MNNEMLLTILMALISVMAAFAVGMIIWVLVARTRSTSNDERKAVKENDDHIRILQFQLQQNAPWKHKLLAISEYIGYILNNIGITRDLTKRYAAAGWPGHFTDNQLSGFIIFPMLIISLIGVLVGILASFPPAIFLCPVLGFAVGYFVVKQWISAKRQNYLNSLGKTMPYIMDLIVMSMRSGASFIMTLEMVINSYTGTAAAQEFSLVLDNINRGGSIADAVWGFKQRFPMLPIISTFADDVVNSNRYGNPLAEVLENSSHRFKEMRIQYAREQAGNAKVKIMAPGVLILLGALMLLFGPFGVKFAKGGGMNGGGLMNMEGFENK